MIKRLIIAVVLLALIGGGLIGFNLFRDNMIKQIFANMPAQVMPVTTMTVEPASWNPVIEGIGSVNAAQGIDLTVETAGIVNSIAFQSNQKVEQGALLVQLDETMQAADLEAARSNLELARTNLERAQQLTRRGVTADANLDSTRAAARAAEAQVAAAQAVVDQRRLIAPFAGTIGLPRVDPGDYITPGTVVATLQDLDRMRVDFSLPEQRLGEIAIGQALTVRAGTVDRDFTGTITGIDPRVDASSRMVAVRGEIGNAGQALTPGQFVRVSVALPQQDNVIALPQTAVISSLYGDFVYIIQQGEGTGQDGQPQLQVRQVFVVPGRYSGGRVEITGDSVKAGEQVVTSGQNRLGNGTPVTIDNSVTPDGLGQPPPTPTEGTAQP